LTVSTTPPPLLLLLAVERPFRLAVVRVVVLRFVALVLFFELPARLEPLLDARVPPPADFLAAEPFLGELLAAVVDRFVVPREVLAAMLRIPLLRRAPSAGALPKNGR
jgi:hypothetical protein